MYKLTFDNADESHALYAVSADTLYQYLYKADLQDTAYTIRFV